MLRYSKKLWVVDKLLLEHVELPHDLDLAVHLVHLGGYGGSYGDLEILGYSHF